jgi:ATP-dependent DNA helicase RecG
MAVNIMRTIAEIGELLGKLDNCVADDLEDQELDFKQWDSQSLKNSLKTVVDMAVCMANGEGGVVVFGVVDRVKGRSKAILGVPNEIDVNMLKQTVYDRTDPRLVPVFEELSVPEGTGRLLVMKVYHGLPPYTDTSGHGTIRVGKNCLPLTGTMRRKISVETGDTDYTAEAVHAVDTNLLSPAALEALRATARKELAPDELLGMSDTELLSNLGLIKKKKLTRAALLLAGSEEAIKQFIHGYNWTFLQMASDSDYAIREDRVTSLILAVRRIEELLTPFNPITTYKQGLFHFEYRTWPEIAVREALMNAFCHADLRIAGPVMVKLYQDRLEISNNGGFIAGITPDNILHHPPAARNPLLVEAMTRLRLVNRSNLGINRMFSALLSEGKEPPVIQEMGDSVVVKFYKREFNAAFRSLVAEESGKGHIMNVDELIVLQYLLIHPEMDTATAARICQRNESDIRESLSSMEKTELIEHGGSKRGAYWSINPNLYKRLATNSDSEKRRRIDWEAAKTRVLSILMERANRGERGLSNEEIRHITKFNRNQVYNLMNELRAENSGIMPPGRGKYARYEFRV